jgi:phage terminase small subunit
MQDRLPTGRKNKPLTQKQKRFVVEYLVDLNATQAAVRAGYSKQSAKAISYDLVRKPHVRQAIKDKLRYLEKKNEASIQRTLAELKAIAYLDPRDIVSWGQDYVTLRESVDLPPEIAGAVQAVEMTKEGAIKVKFWNKLEALEKLGKYHHMWSAPTKSDDERTGRAPIHFTLKIGDSVLPPKQQEVPDELQPPPGRSIDFTQPAQLPPSKLAPEVTEFIDEIADEVEEE